ncbi:hypothetical protein TREMTM_A_00290 [Candidatus Tremblaya princeps]|uniref:Uncharacterized protein n=1 Tax=Tremblaya princeps TaxID=189385 RepID=A0A1C3K8V0_TREPR|nr:hypothetical protein TREMTM_A_00290 [Candidatus Tremblaya princeps]
MHDCGARAERPVQGHASISAVPADCTARRCYSPCYQGCRYIVASASEHASKKGYSQPRFPGPMPA